MAELTNAPATQEKALVIERVFDAPRDLVWKAWSEPERFMRWYGPKGFTTPVCKIDFRVGGAWLNCMRSPDGQEFWSTGVYREIVAMERIVTTMERSDADGNVVPATPDGMDADVPIEMLMTVTFEEQAGKTKMSLRHEGLPAGEMREGAGQAWNQAFDKLGESLAQA